MPEMRKCKECGKLFLPKGREQYCSEDHYRPCPVCGEPVIVKYFNDPPRRCDNCKWRKIKPLPKSIAAKSKSPYNFIPKDGRSAGEGLKDEVELIEEMEKISPGAVPGWMDMIDIQEHPVVDPAIFCETMTGSVKVYIGKPHKNSFIPGHEYLMKVERNEYWYVVTSVEDLTSNDTCDCMLPISSQTSFYQQFARLRQRGEHSGIGHNGW